MDKNTATGLFLILAIIIGFGIWNKPSDEEVQAFKLKQDSIAQLEQLNLAQPKTLNSTEIKAPVATEIPEKQDSIQKVQQQNKLGSYASLSTGKVENTVLENDLIKLTISNKGGKIITAQLKKYHTYDSLPLLLIEGERNKFDLQFSSNEFRNINTEELFFKPIKKGDKSLTMRLELSATEYIDYVYTLTKKDYLIDFDVNFVGMNSKVAGNLNAMTLNIEQFTPQQEKSIEQEKEASTIYYKYKDDEVDYLSERSDDAEELTSNVRWVSLKQKFFNTTIIAKDGFENPTNIETKSLEEPTDYVKQMSAKLTIPYGHKPVETFAMQMYLGPNHYKTLEAAGLQLQDQIPLGWGIFGWVNKWIVIPIFNFLDGFNLGYGIIILILTLIIKAALFPLTYKAYLSSAKMKVLRPEIEIATAKHKGDAIKSQQETMKLYKSAGVNPMGGCVPMLLQMPILFALFRFFPASIELRQESFLWADDLSSYDSIYDLGFNIPFYGDHISLFTILMTISTILYTRMNQNNMAGNPQMEQMKWMMYLMPIMFLGFFNNYAAGLSYYYFLANMITFGQQFLMQKFIDEDAILAKIEQNKKVNKNKPKSKFQQKLEEMAKQRSVK